jgi:DNA-directed RNA polymerase I, II, and III subunit RPABC2
MSIANLEEVDVEEQLEKLEESGNDTQSIVLSEKEDDDLDEELESDEELEDSDNIALSEKKDTEKTTSNGFNVGDIVYYETRGGDNEWKILRINELNKFAIKNLTTEERELVEYTEIKHGNAWQGQIDMGNDLEKQNKIWGDNTLEPQFNETENLEELSSEEDSDEEYAENMNKLEQDVNRDYLQSYHPETKQINYKELLTLSNVTRNKKGLIIDPLHKTIPILTRYEKAKILGLRAKQINHGAKPFVEISRDIIDGHTIAYMELVQNKIPFIIRRPMPSGGSEYWKISDLKNID